MQDVKIELKKIENQVAELEIVKRKAEYLTKQRILQSQEAAKLKELEKTVNVEVSPQVVAPSPKK
jgi:hypothetical protein